MANNTEEWWSITDESGEELSLHQYGWSVTTVGGSRYDLPPRRGSNMTMAYRPGQIYRRKLPDARPITLMMFMVGWDPAIGQTTVVSTDDQRVQWNDNWDRLRRLVYRRSLSGDMIDLTRRWRLTAPEFPTSRDGLPRVIAGDPGTSPSGVSRIVTATAQAEMTGNMAPTMTGRSRSDFQLDLLLPDPFFYGEQVQYTLEPGQTSYVWNDGHDIAAHAYMEVAFVGPLTNVIVRNVSTDPSNTLRYSGTIPAGQTVNVNVGRFTAWQNPTGDPPLATSTNNRIQYIANVGARHWYNLLPGSNKVNCNADSGSGHVEVRFRPPYV